MLAQIYRAGLAKVPANWATPPEFDLECCARPDEFVDDSERTIAVLVQVVPQSIGYGKISQTEREYLRRKLQALADPKRSHSPRCVEIFIHHQTYAHYAMVDQVVQQQLAARLADDNGRPHWCGQLFGAWTNQQNASPCFW